MLDQVGPVCLGMDFDSKFGLIRYTLDSSEKFRTNALSFLVVDFNGSFGLVMVNFG